MSKNNPKTKNHEPIKCEECDQPIREDYFSVVYGKDPKPPHVAYICDDCDLSMYGENDE